MREQSFFIWSYSLLFLEYFHGVSYQNVPLSLLLLRDFQKWLEKHKKTLGLPQVKSINRKAKKKWTAQLQQACQPYLLSNPAKKIPAQG